MNRERRRLKPAYAALTVHQRVVLGLNDAASDEFPDYYIQSSMPHRDRPAYRRLAALCLRLNNVLAHHGSLELAQIDTLQMKLTLYGAIQLLVDRERVDAELARRDPEPITATAYARLFAAARAELLPLATIAERLAGVDDNPEVILRQRKRIERRLQRAIREGDLASTHGTTEPLVEVGACYDMFGEEVPVFSEWTLPYQVVPDTRADAVHTALAYRRRIADKLMARPRLSDIFPHEVLAADIDDDIRRRWLHLRAIQVVVDEVREELHGEDPLLPQFRAELNEIETRLVSLHGQLAELVDDVHTLEDATTEAVDAVRNHMFVVE